MQMQLGIESRIPDGLLAAKALLAENSRLGVPTSKHALHRGFDFAISSTYMGLQFRCYEIASDPVVAPNNEGKQNVFQCGAEAAGKISLAGGLSHIPGLGSGVGGFITNAVGGNAFSGLTDLISSFGSGSGGGHSVFYNMGQGVIAGPTQGFGAAFGSAIEGTPFAADLVDVGTTALVGAEYASGIGEVKLGYDFLTYAGGVAGCAAGIIK
jgi:hypothetical protein